MSGSCASSFHDEIVHEDVEPAANSRHIGNRFFLVGGADGWNCPVGIGP
ncbi:hypothetical protein [Rhizorhapis sp. SPR117]|nr:hypothetical protein [Rhizorhapis sp. SPR117]